MMELEGVTKLYDGVAAVADVSLTVREDEYLTLLGPSGSGKSTLLRVIAGLERADAGTVRLNGEDITLQAPHRRGLGIVQQNYALFPHMTVEENVAFGLRYREKDPVTDEAELRRRVSAMLVLVGLDGLEGRMVGQISGGQKQRVSLARTLVTEPRICLLDEPLGALDANLRERMTVELRRIREVLGVTFLHVTGNEAEALAMGDRMIVLDEGRAIMIDAPEVVFENPATVRVARFLNAFNLLAGEVRDGAFRHAGAALPLPAGTQGAVHYAVPFDAATMMPEGAEGAPGTGALQATFIASEFMGSRVIYFLQVDGGGVFEVERHLSNADPENHAQGARFLITWPVDSVLAFDADGRLIAPAGPAGGA